MFKFKIIRVVQQYIRCIIHLEAIHGGLGGVKNRIYEITKFNKFYSNFITHSRGAHPGRRGSTRAANWCHAGLVYVVAVVSINKCRPYVYHRVPINPAPTPRAKGWVYLENGFTTWHQFFPLYGTPQELGMYIPNIGTVYNPKTGFVSKLDRIYRAIVN